MKKIWEITLSFGILLAIWQGIVAIGNFSPALLPSPWAVGEALFELFANGVMIKNILVSLYRFAMGYSIAVAFGAILGLVLGWYPKLFGYTNPILQYLRPIAPVAWMPFVVLLIGIGDTPAIVIIFLAAFFPVVLTTANAVRKLDPIYLKIAANYGVKEPEVLWKIVFPAVFPQVANSLHLALGSAWVFLVPAEMIGAQSGLGYMIVDARNNMRTDQLLSAMVVIGIIGLLLDLSIARGEKTVMKLWE
ncbi:MAG: ABC transporter permease [Victivallales bacterium]|nr:ABC transporter permease [Victivallales bacterium]